MKINFNDLKIQYNLLKADLDVSIGKVLEKQNFIMGEEIAALENELKNFSGAKHCITCANGTDALQIALMAAGIGPGDEVITTPFSFIATVEVIALLGAKPVFADINEKTYNLDPEKFLEKVSPRTKAVIPVSLFGQAAEMDRFNEISGKFGIKVIEDAAQSFGARYKDRRSCSLSELACTSFFPSKPLGCYGDGGAVFTDNDALAEKIRSIRVHGQEKKYYYQYVGVNSRLDTIQAAVLLSKMKLFAEECDKREKAGSYYTELLSGKQNIITPYVEKYNNSVYAQYALRSPDREAIMKKLNENEIPSMIYYPHPLHLQKAFAYLGNKEGDYPITEKVSKEIFSIPFSPYITKEEQEFIAGLI
ncbi:MAG TPA: DegT/DnrJ/EryC1/StrS family aminotransferase [Leptospiraceae bacterium]|nr:DegT/DnrJ/EryC1/StrS family aminotransferase [Leptospiraceae bacterium]HMY66300.1 DegT/DnrJ/EryC1/StrS family aminotransferase [Leptospiraceae bacterium]HNF12149.1 DegT/DnrJ/EryC1/StrS family aminotransferase [Leptospiraceae bacterium]HNI95828.1 DegT/DnrJ/EryC1/StrS family aminotransferase [Leptospiraceae bacterium]HNM02258.1 DegT/DnrJ/EryC1/StrS family aminotransferase [Leptospiraceae bacterium]